MLPVPERKRIKVKGRDKGMMECATQVHGMVPIFILLWLDPFVAHKQVFRVMILLIGGKYPESHDRFVWEWEYPYVSSEQVCYQKGRKCSWASFPLSLCPCGCSEVPLIR